MVELPDWGTRLHPGAPRKTVQPNPHSARRRSGLGVVATIVDRTDALAAHEGRAQRLSLSAPPCGDIPCRSSVAPEPPQPRSTGLMGAHPRSLPRFCCMQFCAHGPSSICAAQWPPGIGPRVRVPNSRRVRVPRRAATQSSARITRRADGRTRADTGRHG